MSTVDPSAATAPIARAVPAQRSWLVRIAGLAIGLGLLALSGYALLDGPDAGPASPVVDPVVDPVVEPASVSP